MSRLRYSSTRDSSLQVSSSEAILQGISKDGGLFVPETIPAFAPGELAQLQGSSYQEVASAVLSRYLTDFSQEEIDTCVKKAYGSKFPEGEAPLAALKDGLQVLELWHGPTCAFKDMALQMLPQLLTVANKKAGDGKTILILVATSGDTGKAALEGFCDVPGTEIAVFYPQDGVSHMQKRQMVTQAGENVHVCGVDGNFDDCQTGVKRIFTDGHAAAELAAKGMRFSSANSINWGRLAPQIVYYVYAYLEMCRAGQVAMGEPVNFAVPTGNFGNILAAYFAKEMGVPVGKLICASNRNNVLTDFLREGRYDRNRPFYTTLSPSMDILVSSNLERLLYLLSGRDDGLIGRLYRDLSDSGRFAVKEEMLGRLKESFAAGCADDAETSAAIKEVYDRSGYLCDPHTAVAFKVYGEYRAATGDKTPTVVVSTASPYKFPASVLEALGGELPGKNDFSILSSLEERSGAPAPVALKALRDKPIRFGDCCMPGEMFGWVKAVLNI
ncbi:threonine synthase [Bittarella massiliensis]|nr:threonine synthase [Bittarella massiliensis (ex Durand et al. 2017)]